MKKVISFGKFAVDSKRRINEIKVTIELKYDKGKDFPVFSASGEVWDNKKWDNDIIMGGQCLDTLAEYVKTPLFTEIYDLWQKYHLNDLNAGTPEQTAYLDAKQAEGWKYDYKQACDMLSAAGLNPVNFNGQPYYYGHAWIYRAIPEEDLNRIKALF